MTDDDLFTLILGSKNTSSWSLRAWLMMRQCGVPFKEEIIQFRQPDTQERLLDLSPSGLVPALRHKDRLIWDSLAIGEYLAERFPMAHLWPLREEARAIARSVSAEMHSRFFPMRSTMAMYFLDVKQGFVPEEKTQKNIDRIKTIWTDCRTRFGSEGDFLFGKWSNADSMYAPVVSRFRTYGIACEGAVKEYCDAVWSHGEMKAWWDQCEAEREMLNSN